jgi:hypothetical protein
VPPRGESAPADSDRTQEATIDFSMYMDVLRRSRTLVKVGLAITVALVVLSYVRISPSGISYRTPEGWSNEATLVLSEPGFPELRSVPPGASPSLATDRLAGLVDFYAALATSDAVVAALRRTRAIEPEDVEDGKLPFSASAVPSSVGGPSSLMRISATGTSASEATALTVAATNRFLDLLRKSQQEANIPEAQRVEVRVVKRSGEPTLVAPRSKTTPIVILLAGLTIVGAAAFVRDNFRRVRPAPPDVAEAVPQDENRMLRPDLRSQPPAEAPASVQAVPPLEQEEAASDGQTAAQARWSSGPTR